MDKDFIVVLYGSVVDSSESVLLKRIYNHTSKHLPHIQRKPFLECSYTFEMFHIYVKFVFDYFF